MTGTFGGSTSLTYGTHSSDIVRASKSAPMQPVTDALPDRTVQTVVDEVDPELGEDAPLRRRR